MHIDSERLENGFNNIHGAIDPRLLKDSQEYYALAVLKTLYPDDYKDLKKKEEDRPDLKSIDEHYGVEVTTADSNEDNADNRLLSQYCETKNKKLKNKIEQHNKNVIEIHGITNVIQTGGYSESRNDDNELLIKSIVKKIDSAKKYLTNYDALELVVIKNELVPSIWENGIISCINHALENQNEVFRKVHLIYKGKCYSVTSDGNYSIKNIENNQKLRLLARLTAEKEILPDDYEWDD